MDLPRSIIGMVCLRFVGYYMLGLVAVQRERKIARYRLPLTIRRILFLNLSYKYTLNTIIYQVGVILIFIITVIIFIFDFFYTLEEYQKYIIYSFFHRCNFVLFIIEVICTTKLNIMERREEKRNRKNRKF